MKITKDNNKNSFTITGLTLGKLLAMQRAFKTQLNTTGLSNIGEDMVTVIDSAVKEAVDQNLKQNPTDTIK